MIELFVISAGVILVCGFISPFIPRRRKQNLQTTGALVPYVANNNIDDVPPVNMRPFYEERVVEENEDGVIIEWRRRTITCTETTWTITRTVNADDEAERVRRFHNYLLFFNDDD